MFLMDRDVSTESIFYLTKAVLHKKKYPSYDGYFLGNKPLVFPVICLSAVDIINDQRVLAAVDPADLAAERVLYP